jgi:putative hemin transport protein
MNGRYQHYLSLKTTHPQKHTSELAAQMAISEAELFFCRLGQDVVQLRPDFTALLHGLSLVGEIKILPEILTLFISWLAVMTTCGWGNMVLS